MGTVAKNNENKHIISKVTKYTNQSQDYSDNDRITQLHLVGTIVQNNENKHIMSKVTKYKNYCVTSK